MKNIAEIVTYACLLFLLYQDLRYRAVYWWLFLILPVGLAALSLLQLEAAAVFTQFVANAGFFITQLVLMWLYFSIRHRKMININNLVGLGDILFLLVLAVYLPPFNYIAFYIGSLLVIVAFTVFSRNTASRIPLAGLQAFLLLVLMLTSRLSTAFNLTHELSLQQAILW